MILVIDDGKFLDTTNGIIYEPQDSEHTGFHVKMYMPNGDTHTVWREFAHALWNKLSKAAGLPVMEGE